MDDAAQTRRREIATEHPPFKPIAHGERRYPGLLAGLEVSLGHLGHFGDPADGADNEALRRIARRTIAGARRARA